MATSSFIAEFPSARFSRYLLTYPAGVSEGIDYGIVPDPAGSGRQVAYFDNSRGLRHDVTMDRAAAEAPRFVRPAVFGNTVDEFWFGASVFLPSPPAVLDGPEWFSMATPAFGAPYSGTSPLSLGVRPWSRDAVQLILGGDHRNLGWNFTMPTNRWCRVLINFKFAYDGWARMWVGTGLSSTAWSAVPIRGKSRCPMPTMGHGVNDACALDPKAAGNSTRIGAYGWRSRVYYGHHVLTPSLDLARRAMR